MNKWDQPVDVICSEDLTPFATRRIARDFFYAGMLGTDGSERDRYVNIFTALEETDDKMVHDGVYGGKIPVIRGISKFVGDRIVEVKRFEEPITYHDYVSQQKQ